MTTTEILRRIPVPVCAPPSLLTAPQYSNASGSGVCCAAPVDDHVLGRPAIRGRVFASCARDITTRIVACLRAAEQCGSAFGPTELAPAQISWGNL